MKKLTSIFSFVIVFANLVAQIPAYHHTKENSFVDVVRDDGVVVPLLSLQTDETLPSNRPGISSSLPCSEDATYFKAYYENGSGFEDDNNTVHLQRREVLCHVLNTLSRLVIPADPQRLVRIKVININQPELLNEVDDILAAAKSFYTYPVYIGNIGGIADNTVWKTINSGQDAYADLFTYGGIFPSDYDETIEGASFYYHAVLYVNFNDEDAISEIGDVNNFSWNYDVSIPCPSNKMDLYSVLLHEMVHALGFNTNISTALVSDINGNGYFSRYDHHLRTPDGTLEDMDLPIIYAENQPVWMYYNSFNPNLGTYVLAPNNDDIDFDTSIFPPLDCTAPQNGPEYSNTNCANAIRFGEELQIPVYTPRCFQPGSSLSHLDDQCSGVSVPEYEYYLMAFGFANGNTRRLLQQDEHNILCELGYHLNDRMGFLSDGITDDGVFDNEFYYLSVCGGEQIVGFIDGIDEFGAYEFISVGEGNILLTGEDLLTNDLVFGENIFGDENLRIEGLELIQGIGSISVSSTDINGLLTANSQIVIDPTPSESDEFVQGMRMLRYIPVRNGIRGNITYVYIRFISEENFQGADQGPFGYEDCIPSICNLIGNGILKQTLRNVVISYVKLWAI